MASLRGRRPRRGRRGAVAGGSSLRRISRTSADNVSSLAASLRSSSRLSVCCASPVAPATERRSGRPWAPSGGAGDRSPAAGCEPSILRAVARPAAPTPATRACVASARQLSDCIPSHPAAARLRRPEAAGRAARWRCHGAAACALSSGVFGCRTGPSSPAPLACRVFSAKAQRRKTKFDSSQPSAMLFL